MSGEEPIPLSRPAVLAEMKEAVCAVLDGGQYVLGGELQRFEEEFARFVGVRCAVGVSSGTEALHLALAAAGVGPGDEVVTTPNTFISTALAATYLGARPVLVDVDATYTMDPARLEAALTPRTKAVIPVHLYGHTCDMDPIREVAERRGVLLLEDACQAHGATYRDGRRAGALADAACFSFYPSKNMTVAGEGGMFVSDDEALAERVRALRNYGVGSRKGVAEVIGYNAKLCEVFAAVGRVQLRRLEGWVERRQRHAELYTRLLGEAVATPRVHWGTHAFHLYVVRHPRRDELKAHLESHGIQTGVHYPLAIHQQPCYAGVIEGSFPVAERFAREVLSLPMFPALTDDQIRRVCAEVRAFAGGAG